MANSRDPRMAKVYDKKSIYYHCVSLKKLLSQEEQALMQPLEDSLRQQDKLRPPCGECHFCHDRGHWIGDCPEAQKFREQQISTDKKPTYEQCYICGLEDHWAPNCHKREENLINEESQPKLVDYSDSESSDDEDNIRPPQRKRIAMVIYSDDEDEEELTSQQSSVSTEKQQIESSVSTEKPSRKRKASDVSDISPKRRRLDTRSRKTVSLGKKPYCFICKSTSHSPRSCTKMVTENWDKRISCDEPDSIVHIH